MQTGTTKQTHCFCSLSLLSELQCRRDKGGKDSQASNSPLFIWHLCQERALYLHPLPLKTRRETEPQMQHIEGKQGEGKESIY